MARGGADARARDSAASVVVPSRLVAADVGSIGVDASRITVVAGGADHLPAPDPGATDAPSAAVGVRGEFLLTVGTLEPRKNVDRLVEAYAQVRPSLPRPWPLVVVGPDGWGPSPRARPRPAGSSSRVRFPTPCWPRFTTVPAPSHTCR